jgi:hypothetical protein
MLTGFDRTLLPRPAALRGMAVCGLSRLAFLVFVAAMLAGCSAVSLLPSQKQIVVTRWNSFGEAKNAFDLITPYKTKIDGLEELGFAPLLTPNIRILNYLDIMGRFLPNQSITIEDLAAGLQDCLADQEQCTAYEVIIRKFDSQRYGNVFLDLFNFRRKTNVSGWEFKALIVIKDSLVVYKLSSGTPQTDELHDTKNPLGPLQSPDRIVWRVVE